MNRINRISQYSIALILIAQLFACTSNNSTSTTQVPDENKWISLFNGKDFDGWIVKFTSQQVGVNYKNTFRAENGVIKVSYDNYETFNGEFGHLFYHQPYSHYIIRMDYRFTGEQTPNSPEWAYRNAGIMFHAQSPQSMSLDQSFPVCVELQMLGGNGVDDRPTGNMCSPSSHVVINGKLEKTHCINSSSKTFHGDQWVSMELEVHGNSVIKHRVNGELVFEYGKPVLDSTDADAQKLLAMGASKIMNNGYIAIQAETHPVEYRNIELLPLAAKQ